jgi:tetratricopeptide (TPR) repeat protein
VLGAVGLQVEHLFVPASLSPRYPLASVETPHLLVGALVIVIVAGLGVTWLRRGDRRLGWLALGVATYLPASNLRPLIRFTADSYVYVPWMATMGVAALSFVMHEARLRELAQRSFGALRALVFLALPGWAVISHLEVETWADTESLWKSAAERYPDDGELIYRYGDALGRAGKPEAELRLYLSHLDALSESPRIPFALPTWYLFEGELDEVDTWYARAFASDVRQDDPLYWNYVDYVARHPERHRAEHDVALGHALGIYAQDLGSSRLDADQLEHLIAHAERLGRPDVAGHLRKRHADVLGSGPVR